MLSVLFKTLYFICDAVVSISRRLFRNTRVQEWVITEKVYSYVMSIRTGSAGSEDFLVDFRGSQFYFEPGDITILPTLISGEYEKQEIKRLLDFAQKDDKNYKLIDVGANIGLYSIIFAKEIIQKKSFKRNHSNVTEPLVFAFEPDPRNLTRLYRNVELNLKSRDPFAIFEVGVSDSVGKLEFNLSKYGGTSRIESSQNQTGIEIEVTTLDKFWVDFIPPDEDIILKIDTEGHESSVLRGGMSFVKTNLPVIFLEIFPNSSNLDLELMEEILNMYNRFEYISGDTTLHFHSLVASQLQSFKKYGNLIIYKE
jgi:FkbM family methyltransferase